MSLKKIILAVKLKLDRHFDKKRRNELNNARQHAAEGCEALTKYYFWRRTFTFWCIVKFYSVLLRLTFHLPVAFTKFVIFAKFVIEIKLKTTSQSGYPWHRTSIAKQSESLLPQRRTCIVWYLYIPETKIHTTILAV